MADLGKLWFGIGLKDNTDEDWARIIKNIEKKGAKLGISIDDKNLHSQINQALQNRKYTIDLSLAIKDDQLEAAIQRAYSRVYGAAGSMAGSIRPSREDQLIRAGAYAGSQQALERSRNALAELREARLKDAEAARQQKAANAELNNAMVKTNSIASQLRNEILGVYSIYTVQNFLRSVIEIGGEFEKQQIALGSILRDAGQATEIFSNIKNLAVVSPFGIRELTSYAKQLAAFSIPYNELYDTTKRLADISAGLGVDMSRIILAYGQVRSAEFLKGTELRQFTEAGIPLVQALAEKFTELEGRIVSAGDVMDMISKRKVSFENVKEVLWEMTETGGMFNNMQEELSESLAGKWSNLKDAYDIMLADIAESSSSIAKGMIEGLTDVMRNWEYLIPLIFSAASGLVVYKSSLVGLNLLHGRENASILKNAMLLKQKQANMLRVAQSYRTLTKAELGAIASSNKMTTADYRQLAVSGQLTKEYALRLMALGKLKAGQAGHIAQLLQISRAEMAAAVNAGRLRVTLSTIGVALRSLLFNPFTIVFAGLSAILELYTSWKQKDDEMERNIEELSQKASGGYKSIHNQLKQFEGIEVGGINDNSLISSIEQITEALKNYSPRYNDIQKEADGIENLADRYKHLLDALHETENAYKILEDIKDISEDANESTDGWFDESLRENVQDYSEALQDAQKKLRDLGKYSINIGSAIQAAMGLDGEYAKAASGKSLNEQISLLMDYSSAYGEVLRQLSGKAGRPALIAYFDAVRESNEVFKNEVLPDVESYSDYIKESLEAEGWDFSKLTKAQEDALRMAVLDFTKKIPDITEEARKKIEDEVLTVRFKLSPVIEDYDAKPVLGNYAKLMKSVSGNLFSEKELSNVHSAASAYELWNNRMKEAEEELASLKRMKEKAMTPEQKDYYEAELKASQAQYDSYKKAGDLLFNEEKKKKGRDVIADQWKERIKLIEKAISTYKEWAELEGKGKAYQRVQSNQTFSPVLSYIGTEEDISDPSKIWEKVLKEIPKDKKELVMEVGFKIEKSGQDKLKSDIDKSLKDVEEHIKKTTEQWNLYKNLLQSGVSGDVAMRLSFGGENPFANMAEQIKSEISKALEESRTTISMEQLLGMDEKSMDLTFGAELGGKLAKLVRQYKDADDEIYRNTLTSAAKLIAQNRSYEDQIVEIKRKANEDIKNLEAQRAKFGDESTDKAIAQRRENEQKEIADIMFEQFKNTDDWAKTFEDLDRLSTATIDRIIKKLEELKNTTGQNLDVTEFKELVNALKRLREESESRNPFKAVVEGINEYAEATKKLKQAREEFDKIKNEGTGSLTGISEESHTEEKTLGSGLTVKEKVTDKLIPKYKSLAQAEKDVTDADDEQKASSEKLREAFGNIIEIGSELIGTLGNLSLMFETLGNDSMADVLGMAEQVGNGLISIGQGALGMMSGNPLAIAKGAAIAIGGITGIISSIANFHDKKLDRAIEQSQLRAEKLKNTYDAIERGLERFLGTGKDLHLVEVDNDIAQLEKLNEKIAQLSKHNNSFASKYFLGKNIKEAEKYQKRVDAFNEGGAYGYQRQLLEEQIAELEKQRAAELDKKDVDQSKVADYEAQIAELKDKVADFSREVAESLYGINLKDWASQLGDSLYEAWQKGEDGAEAFKEKSAEILGSVMNDILKLSILEPAMQNLQEMLFGEDGKSGMFGSDFELSDSEIESIADELMGVSEKSDDYYDALDKLNEYMKKKYGVSMKEEEKEDSGGLSAGIKGITEDTADLLASYINAMRADVSLERGYIEKIANDLFPKISVLAQAQLTQLEAIARNTKETASNTSRNADLVGEIRDIINSARINKEKGFYMK